MFIYQPRHQVRGCSLNNYCQKNVLTLDLKEICQKRLPSCRRIVCGERKIKQKGLKKMPPYPLSFLPKEDVATNNLPSSTDYRNYFSYKNFISENKLLKFTIASLL